MLNILATSFDDIKLAFIPMAFLSLFFLCGFIVGKYAKSAPLALFTITLLALLVNCVTDVVKLEELGLGLGASFVMIFSLFASPVIVLVQFLVDLFSLNLEVEILNWIAFGASFIIFLIGLLVCIPARREEGGKFIKVIKVLFDLLIFAWFIFIIASAYMTVHTFIITFF